MREDNIDRGLRQRRAVLGVDWVDRATANATAFTAPWQAFITETAWQGVWGREGLDTETRRLLVMTATLALGRMEEFEMHMNAAVKAGISEANLQDMLHMAAIYCGVPAANNGFRIAAQSLAAHGRAPVPLPLQEPWREKTFQTFSQPQSQVVVQGPATGTPVVLCHALGLDLSMWAEVARHLAGRGHPVLRYDVQGHGASLMGPQVSIATLVDDAARIIQEWDCGPVVMVGLSMGGMVAQGLAIRHPQLVRALVLANTAARYPEGSRDGFGQRAARVRAEGMAAIIDEVVPRYLSPDFMASNPAATARLRERLLRCSPIAYAACCEALADADLEGGLANIAVPTWVVSGKLDQAAPQALQTALVHGIAHARHTVLPCAHLPTMEAPEAFINGLDHFLAGLVHPQSR